MGIFIHWVIKKKIYVYLHKIANSRSRNGFQKVSGSAGICGDGSGEGDLGKNGNGRMMVVAVLLAVVCKAVQRNKVSVKTTNNTGTSPHLTIILRIYTNPQINYTGCVPILIKG